MSPFSATRKRLEQIQQREPDFPLPLITLTRLNYHLHCRIHDITNAVLKRHGLVEVTYMTLAVLYGSPGETLSPSQLAQACSQKPANITRICNDLKAQGLIHRASNADDRRAVSITLSDAGRERITRVLPDVCAALEATIAGFSAAELQQQEQFYLRQLHNLSGDAGHDPD